MKGIIYIYMTEHTVYRIIVKSCKKTLLHFLEICAICTRNTWTEYPSAIWQIFKKPHLPCKEQKDTEVTVYELNRTQDCLDKTAKYESKAPPRAVEGVKKSII